MGALSPNVVVISMKDARICPEHCTLAVPGKKQPPDGRFNCW